MRYLLVPMALAIAACSPARSLDVPAVDAVEQDSATVTAAEAPYVGTWSLTRDLGPSESVTFTIALTGANTATMRAEFRQTAGQCRPELAILGGFDAGPVAWHLSTTGSALRFDLGAACRMIQAQCPGTPISTNCSPWTDAPTFSASLSGDTLTIANTNTLVNSWDGVYLRQ